MTVNDAIAPWRSGDPAAGAATDAVLDELRGMLLRTLAEFGLSESDAAGITMETMFYGDLEMESIDLVTLAGQLEERYGNAVNFAAFIAGFDLIEIIGLRVGQLVEYVVSALQAPTADPAR